MPEQVVIVGGGIVGVAVAWQLLRRFPETDVTVVEKERSPGLHQTGRNSGVLHSGIYYRPGSLRAENCRAGKLAMEAFCTEEGIPFERCGKLIVAVEPRELPALDNILARGKANGVACRLLDSDAAREIEPHVAALRAVHVPEAGIVDFRQVCLRLAQRVTQAGGRIVCGTRVTGIRTLPRELEITTSQGTLRAAWLVNCAGLHSDRVARLSGARPEARIVPFRGEYYVLRRRAEHLCRGLIYPVPDPRFPFLGVHLTRMIYGGVECGPNAVLALAREGYRWRDIDLRDLAETLGFRGFRRMALRYWRTGLAEMWRSVSRRAFCRSLQRLVPELALEDLLPGSAGVRAQAVGLDGELVDDFRIEVAPRVVNVCNAPSPAATASLNVGRLVVERLAAAWA